MSTNYIYTSNADEGKSIFDHVMNIAKPLKPFRGPMGYEEGIRRVFVEMGFTASSDTGTAYWPGFVYISGSPKTSWKEVLQRFFIYTYNTPGRKLFTETAYNQWADVQPKREIIDFSVSETHYGTISAVLDNKDVLSCTYPMQQIMAKKENCKLIDGKVVWNFQHSKLKCMPGSVRTVLREQKYMGKVTFFHKCHRIWWREEVNWI